MASWHQYVLKYYAGARELHGDVTCLAEQVLGIPRVRPSDFELQMVHYGEDEQVKAKRSA
jgi:hypothetical protein